MKQVLANILAKDDRPRILVVGDVMLDRYVWGDVDHISYEAPVPVLRMDRREERLGGAGSVAAMLSSLNVETSLAAVVGDDPAGRSVMSLLDSFLVTPRILVDEGRRTTIKERLLGRTQGRHPQQVMRIDCEDINPISQRISEQLLRQLLADLKRVDLMLVSDYGKGVCSVSLLRELVAAAREADVPVIVDPARDVDFRCYAGVTAITPNRAEAGLALGRTIASPADGLEAARELLAIGVDSVLVTLDRDGIAWADRTGTSELFPVVQRQVYDVTGAGDAVLSALGFGLAAGADWSSAIQLANLAGGLEVQQLGVVTFERQDLLHELDPVRPSANGKVVPLDRLQNQLQLRRQNGCRIVMTNGCYDLLHPGHLESLLFARRQGDCLVVGVNSDRSVRQLKGKGRPIMDQATRVSMLASLECVDYVVLFDDTSVTQLVADVHPDVLVKSSQYELDEVVGHEIVEQYGGQVVLAPMKSGYSTSDLIRRIKGLDGLAQDQRE